MSGDDRSPFQASVRESNRQGRPGWERFAPHRAKVMELLTAHLGRGARLCLLGPGNLNDVDLERLLAICDEVHLVDLDADAVSAALVKSGLAGHTGVTVHAPVDLTGLLARLPARPAAAGAGAADRLVEALGRTSVEIPGTPFDVTASTGALTQLLQSVVDSALGPDDVVRVSLAVRDKHLRDLVELTAPGGTAILVSDVVASTTAPRLLRLPADDLDRAMTDLVAAGNFFTGTNPFRITALLGAGWGDRVATVELTEPWLWAVTEDRAHLTYAIVAGRRPAG